MEKIGNYCVKEKLEERDAYLVRLWRFYHFLGEAPLKKSPAEKRLREVCDKYVNLLRSNGQAGNVFGDDGENYFSPLKRNITKLPSNEERKRLHNEICLMVIGKERLGLNTEEAEKISDFACFYVTGQHLNEIQIDL